MAQPRRLDEFGFEGDFATNGQEYFQPPDQSSFKIDAGAPNPNGGLPQQQAQPAPPQGGYDLEKFRKRWMDTGAIFDIGGWLKNNQDITQGVTLKGEKAYDPSGRFIADLVGNYKGGDQSKMSRIFLDHIDSSGKPRKAKLKTPAKTKGGDIDLRPISPTPSAPAAPTMSTPEPAGPAAPDMNSILKQLEGLFQGGGFNQGLVDNRVSSANDAINRARRSRLATNRAALAERGILNSQDAQSKGRMDEDLFEAQAGAVRDIYGDESARADDRMMQALSTAAGLSSEQARQVIEKYRAEQDAAFNQGQLSLGRGRLALDDKLGSGRLRLDEKLGMGGLANQRLGLQNQYNLGIGGLGLDRDRLAWDMTSGSTDQLIRILQAYLGGAENTR